MTPTLRKGDRMTRQEFHAAYEQMPDDFHAELIAGEVYVRGRVTLAHGSSTPMFAALLVHYEMATPGVDAVGRVTLLLSDEDEPEPDVLLRIDPVCGGRSWTTTDDYLAGPPELIIEVADHSRDIDLGVKRRQYATHGVLEYIVLDLRDNRLHWFDLANNRELAPDADGVCRIRAFPGLWIDPVALLADDPGRLFTTLNAGLATPDHAAFVARLAAARTA